MTLLGAITYLRTNILDDIGGLGSEWDDFSEEDSSSFQLRWNNEELVSAINESVNQVYRRILPVKEINTLFDISSKVGTQNYEIDSRILQIVGIRSQSTGESLSKLDIEDVWTDRDLTTKQGVPTYYIQNINSGIISLYPMPAAENIYTLLVYRLPLDKLSWRYKTNDIELREEFIIPMLNYAASICYEKDEANTLDPERVSYFMGKFNMEFPHTSAYSDTRKRYTSNRPIRYGGY